MNSVARACKMGTYLLECSDGGRVGVQPKLCRVPNKELAHAGLHSGRRDKARTYQPRYHIKVS